MKRKVGPLILILGVITTLAFILSQLSTFSQTFAQSAYPPPDSSILSLSSASYPAPVGGTIKPILIPTEKVIIAKVSMDVDVGGLEGKDIVELQIIPDTENTNSNVQTLGITLPTISLHNESVNISIEAIPVGTYRLMIFAPDYYFREPQGYLFQVTETGISNYSGTSFNFTLIPPSTQDLPPCRDKIIIAGTSSPYTAGNMPFEEPKFLCRAERLIDVSNPPKQPEQPTESERNGVLHVGYHYVGPHTFQDNQGVWGRNYVVDPGVDPSRNVT